MNSSKHYLNRALQLATLRRGFCAPNPAVGALIVKTGEIVGEGYHVKAGDPHAEVIALQQAGNQAKGATLYVTLEPCSHTGRTPPCVNAIIKAQLAQVYFGYYDPNPLVAGKGQKLLEAAGLHCEHIPLNEIKRFYHSYTYWTLHKKPWVTVKIAVSQDWKIAQQHGKPAKITGNDASKFTHEKRLHADAILTTINTVLNDDPSLNVRIKNSIIPKPIYLLDSQCRLPKHARICKTSERLTVFHSSQCHPITNNTKDIVIPTDENGLDLRAVIQKIGEDGIHDLWVEAGANAFHTLITQSLANEIYLYQSPTTLGNGAYPLKTSLNQILSNYQEVSSDPLGSDIAHHFIKLGGLTG